MYHERNYPIFSYLKFLDKNFRLTMALFKVKSAPSQVAHQAGANPGF